MVSFLLRLDMLHVLNWFLKVGFFSTTTLMNSILSLSDTKTVSTTTISSWLDCCNSLYLEIVHSRCLVCIWCRRLLQESDGSADCVFWIKLCFSTSLYILFHTFVQFSCGNTVPPPYQISPIYLKLIPAFSCWDPFSGNKGELTNL